MEARDDLDIWGDVLEALRGDERLDASGISVDVTDGVVSLQGEVGTFPEKELATELASRVRGVRAVDNSLRVVPATPRTDAVIADEVRASLRRDVRINQAERIGVSVADGVVTLSGVVESLDEKASAFEDAEAVAGVVEVVNHIQVIPNVIRLDAEIENDVRRKLIEDTIVDATDIHIHVDNGIVTLSGTVDNLYQREAAEDDAWSLPGVRGVINDLQVTLPPVS